MRRTTAVEYQQWQIFVLPQLPTISWGHKNPYPTDVGGYFFRTQSVRCEKKMSNCLHLVSRLRRLLHAVMFNENACSLKGDIFVEAGEEWTEAPGG